ncbi:MAG: hypothetical protein GVY12_09115 [Bacteroidetes bacterium]|jgi:hypothetical protein|nr:hypothetical protein [Bacteroidota bacterium]
MRYVLLFVLWIGQCPAYAGSGTGPGPAQPPIAAIDTTETLDGTTGTWAWRPLVELEGVAFDYLYYSEQRSTVDGVVLKLHNQNAYAIRYRFRVVVRTRTGEYEHPASGTLAPGETVTGDADGLYFTVEERETIAEIGLRGYRIVPMEDVQGVP